MTLFTSFEGRISRKPFWMAVLLIGAVGIALGYFLIFSFAVTGLALKIVQLLISIVFLTGWTAVIVKRLHDRDKAAMPWAVIFIAPSVVSSIISIFQIGYTPMELAGTTLMVPGTIALAASWVAMPFALWMVVELGFLRGTPGSNRFGPNPLESGQVETAQ